MGKHKDYHAITAAAVLSRAMYGIAPDGKITAASRLRVEEKFQSFCQKTHWVLNNMRFSEKTLKNGAKIRPYENMIAHIITSGRATDAEHRPAVYADYAQRVMMVCASMYDATAPDYTPDTETDTDAETETDAEPEPANNPIIAARAIIKDAREIYNEYRRHAYNAAHPVNPPQICGSTKARNIAAAACRDGDLDAIADYGATVATRGDARADIITRDRLDAIIYTVTGGQYNISWYYAQPAPAQAAIITEAARQYRAQLARARAAIGAIIGYPAADVRDPAAADIDPADVRNAAPTITDPYRRDCAILRLAAALHAAEITDPTARARDTTIYTAAPAAPGDVDRRRAGVVIDTRTPAPHISHADTAAAHNAAAAIDPDMHPRRARAMYNRAAIGAEIDRRSVADYATDGPAVIARLAAPYTLLAHAPEFADLVTAIDDMAAAVIPDYTPAPSDSIPRGKYTAAQKRTRELEKLKKEWQDLRLAAREFSERQK